MSEVVDKPSAKISNVVIVGGGTSGWMCAAGIARIAPPNTTITLIESHEIGVIGVGEATIPTLTKFNDFLGINEADMLKQCSGTIKLGIDFVDWYKKGESYFHPFGFFGRDTPEFAFHQLWLRLKHVSETDSNYKDTAGDIVDYNLCSAAAKLERFAPAQGGEDTVLSTMRHAYHIDSKKYGHMLRRYAQNKGVKRLEGRVVDVIKNTQSGHIDSVTLKDGTVIAGDFFVDCSGFKSLLIEGAMQSEFIDWHHYLPCDRAIAIQTQATTSPLPYTKAIAETAGWRWRIPLQNRIGNGLVYSSDFISDEDALNLLMSKVEGHTLSEPLPLKFKTGHRKTFWHKNCVAIGLAGGFIEPLESTSIHLAQIGIERLMNLWPGNGLNSAEITYYNQLMTTDYERTRDFIILHYNATKRQDSEFWRYVKNMTIPESLALKIDMFKHSGRIINAVEDSFTPHSWLAVMLGQGITPTHYDAGLDRIPEDVLIKNMRMLKESVKRTAASLPSHQAYINKHFASVE